MAMNSIGLNWPRGKSNTDYKGIVWGRGEETVENKDEKSQRSLLPWRIKHLFWLLF
jgi:hypothetical protein